MINTKTFDEIIIKTSHETFYSSNCLHVLWYISIIVFSTIYIINKVFVKNLGILACSYKREIWTTLHETIFFQLFDASFPPKKIAQDTSCFAICNATVFFFCKQSCHLELHLEVPPWLWRARIGSFFGNYEIWHCNWSRNVAKSRRNIFAAQSFAARLVANSGCYARQFLLQLAQ